MAPNELVGDSAAFSPAANAPAGVASAPTAPRLRRAFAFGLDLWATIVISQVCAVPVWLVAPPDTRGPALAGTLFGVTLGISYWGFAPLLFGNTLGKSVFGLRLVSADQSPLSAAQLLKRVLTVGAWPVLAVMVIATSSGRHLGDRWARTQVLAADRPRNVWIALALALATCWLGAQVAKLAMRVAVLRSQAWVMAKEHVGGQAGTSGELSWLPVGYHIRNASAAFSLRDGEQLLRVWLQRDGDEGWKVSASERIDADDGSTSIRFGSAEPGAGPVTAVNVGHEPNQPRQLSAYEEQRGDALRVAGKLAEAQAAYARSVAITERLSSEQPEDTALLRELSIGYERLGEVAKDQGHPDEARAAFEKSLSIAKRLATTGPSDPGLQRDLSIGYEKVGDLYMLEAQHAQARAVYESSLEIMKRLGVQQPGNPELQRDLSISYNKLGDALFKERAFAQARENFRSALLIRQQLSAARPGSAETDRDLMTSHDRLTEAELRAGDVPAARMHAQQCLAIAQRRYHANPEELEPLSDLAVAYAKVAVVERAAGDQDATRASLARALELTRTLVARSPDNVVFQRRLAELERE